MLLGLDLLLLYHVSKTDEFLGMTAKAFSF